MWEIPQRCRVDLLTLMPKAEATHWSVHRFCLPGRAVKQVRAG